MKFYLDDGKNIEIDISFDGVRPTVVSITPRKYFKPLNPRIEEDILWNLYNIVEVLDSSSELVNLMKTPEVTKTWEQNDKI